jgi:hypothetical protein
VLYTYSGFVAVWMLLSGNLQQKTPSSPLSGHCPSASEPISQQEVAVRLKRASAISVILIHVRPQPPSTSPQFFVIHGPCQRELGKDISLQKPLRHHTQGVYQLEERIRGTILCLSFSDDTRLGTQTLWSDFADTAEFSPNVPSDVLLQQTSSVSPTTSFNRLRRKGKYTAIAQRAGVGLAISVDSPASSVIGAISEGDHADESDEYDETDEEYVQMSGSESADDHADIRVWRGRADLKILFGPVADAEVLGFIDNVEVGKRLDREGKGDGLWDIEQLY